MLKISKIKEIPFEDRPVERLINKGSSVLSNDELIAILIKTGTNSLSSKDLGLAILNKIDNINDLININYETLIKIKGIGKSKAAIILASIELSKRINQKIVSINKIKMNNPNIIYEYYKNLLKDKKQEYFYAIYLNQKNIIIKDKLLFIGTINYSVVHPREIFKEAYLIDASSVIIVHNHPSGDVLPSREDYDTTSKIANVGKMLGIKLIDHIIIGNKYYSFYENKELD